MSNWSMQEMWTHMADERFFITWILPPVRHARSWWTAPFTWSVFLVVATTESSGFDVLNITVRYSTARSVAFLSHAFSMPGASRTRPKMGRRWETGGLGKIHGHVFVFP